MAKRESAQGTLFKQDITPSRTSVPYNRQKFDAKAKELLNSGKPLYETDGYYLKCFICGVTVVNDYMQVKNKYCLTCDTRHDFDYNKSGDTGSSGTKN